jgi:hypothetical protein
MKSVEERVSAIHRLEPVCDRGRMALLEMWLLHQEPREFTRPEKAWLRRVEVERGALWSVYYSIVPPQ